MNGKDFWTDVGTGVATVGSAIGATISWLYSFPIVSSLFTFLVGAFATFFVQSKLQDRSERRHLRVKAIEELHIPLYLRFEEIKEKHTALLRSMRKKSMMNDSVLIGTEFRKKASRRHAWAPCVGVEELLRHMAAG